MTTHVTAIPEVGQAVRVRNRLATVRAVEPYDSRSPQGRLHIVEVEYLDDFRYPESEQLLWEVETTAEPLGKTTLPAVDANRPDSPKALQAFVNAHRWTRLNRLREAEGIEDEPLLGVWNSAIQVHPYQLEPVIRALSMPRVSLLLADGVGLGKTIQSGLVLEELLLRRRIRRILVVCPAMLQRQWKYELRRKFNLDFEVIDSDSTFQLRRRIGIDTNPWKAFPCIITSMDYLRMPDVLQQFLHASGAGPDTESNGHTLAHPPWDLLIVDECLVRTIRGRWFQHKRCLEAVLQQQEKEVRRLLERRAKAALQRELDAAKESYRYRLKELQDRSREQELNKLAKELVREQAEAVQPMLFEEFEEEARLRVHEIEEQMAVLRQDVERTRELLTKERDHRLNVVLPKRFTLLPGSQGVRVLPLAVTYLIPATAADLESSVV